MMRTIDTREAARRKEVIRKGVTREALSVLEERFPAKSSLFQFYDDQGRPLPLDAQTLSLQAAMRDGEQNVIRYIKNYINN